MTLKNILTAMLLALFSLGLAHAAGGPMNEDLSQILTLSQKAQAAGKDGNAEAFVQNAEAALKQAKEQVEQRSSVSLERIIPRLKTAVREGKAGNLPQGMEAVASAMTDMGKKAPPKFGGGS